MSFIEIFVLSVVQGVTEFLPVSSAAHLLLVPIVTGWRDQGLEFDLAVHVGSLAAVLIYFRHEIAAVVVDWLRSLATGGATANARLGWAVLLGTIPVGLAGLALKDLVETTMRTPEIAAVVMAATLIGFGVLLGWADWRHRGDRDEYQLGWRDVVVIGCAQALALIPGTSRSGITITAALFLGLSREAAARFSFLLSIPVIILAGGLLAIDLISSGTDVSWGTLGLGALLSGISAYLCIHYFLLFIKRIGMQPFVVYRIVLGLVLLIAFL
ncbi:undecaprenyl-diphosphate phosphatase [Fodinicurvata sp. EGI_FJ10296]|uniref:undecaprenyl-diphosphate phosphatase n=1 Tax=Fodinicurvata sp. EGI_FJ10296 TaxID=3231908 RepID=UPI0034572A48